MRGGNGSEHGGVFRWSSGVRGLALLLTRQAVISDARRAGIFKGRAPALIEGGTDSLAASLDSAIGKQPLWLQDMFGATPQGLPISKFLFRRMNPDRKRPGPVTIFIAKDDFEVVIEVDGETLQGDRPLKMLESHFLELEGA
jgi:hypothetical protein